MDNKNAIATQEEKKVVGLIKAMEPQFAAALPEIINSERFTRIAVTCIRQNPKLVECTQSSLLSSLMTAAQLGLEPGILDQCFLIPFKNNKKGVTECQFQLGYKGNIELLRRTGVLDVIRAERRCANDKFIMKLGTKKELEHVPALDHPEGRGEVIGYYAVAELKGGATPFYYMSKQEIIEHEKKNRKGKFKTDPWSKNFDEMAEKTVIKKILKLLPASVELIDNIREKHKNNLINVTEEEVAPKQDYIEVDASMVIDEHTGEVIDSSDAIDEEIIEVFENK